MVSILILLDVVLEEELLLQVLFLPARFNPYSVGCCSGSGKASPLLADFSQFQSLFCWMLFWKIDNIEYLWGILIVSILILLDVVLEVLLAHWPCLSSKCFNPYSVGCCSGSCTFRT